MDAITLKNYRCFYKEQTARLAPLTLLVGENSTGKTSFMAMIRALSDIVGGFRAPDFKEDPYDLGSFDEIAHHRGGRGSQSPTFEAGFTSSSLYTTRKAGRNEQVTFKVTFGKRGTIPVLERMLLAIGDNSIDRCFKTGQPSVLRVKTARGSWEKEIPAAESNPMFYRDDDLVFALYHYLWQHPRDQQEDTDFTPLDDNSPDFSPGDREQLLGLTTFRLQLREGRAFASAPVRSKPSRTYDPSRPTPGPEGDHIPMYLADKFSQDEQAWNTLKEGLEDFGEAAGLFDEISIKQLGKKASEPFQVQIRKFGSGLKGPPRNLIDVGYGVSQVLPVITELLRADAPDMFLLQQPEVHLHPSAQAALGSFFCRVASQQPYRQLVVETHSDHLMDRVRMEVRDGGSGLKPEDVSILFFERDGLDVRIHSLRIDKEGNILGAPDGYRSFFMEETQRSLGLF